MNMTESERTIPAYPTKYPFSNNHGPRSNTQVRNMSAALIAPEINPNLITNDFIRHSYMMYMVDSPQYTVSQPTSASSESMILRQNLQSYKRRSLFRAVIPPPPPFEPPGCASGRPVFERGL